VVGQDSRQQTLDTELVFDGTGMGGEVVSDGAQFGLVVSQEVGQVTGGCFLLNGGVQEEGTYIRQKFTS